ncbi:MAG TPA: M56 family metallopeptidase, partial [Gemmataceae bacterium]|nr:M56 family metallopeptidase [Gemmataceae bacterium]
MEWQSLALDWLVRAAAGGFVFLAAGAVAVRLCRQPAERVRVTGFALLGAILVPWLALAPGLPRWSVGVMPPEPAAAVTPPAAQQPAPVAQPVPPVPPSPEPTPPPAELKADPPPPRPAPTAAPAPELTPPLAEPPAPPPVQLAWSVPALILTGYGVLTASVLAWSLLGLTRLFLLWWRSRPAPAEAVDLLREIAGPAADRVRLLVSDRIDAPLAFAGWRPVIVLPASARDPESLRYSLTHEWSHVERGDVRRWYLVTFAQIVLFYQPLFWWLRRQLRLSQDYLADARAAAQADDPTDYAEYLVTLARRRLGVPGLALGITDRRSNLTRR